MKIKKLVKTDSGDDDDDNDAPHHLDLYPVLSRKAQCSLQ